MQHRHPSQYSPLRVSIKKHQMHSLIEQHGEKYTSPINPSYYVKKNEDNDGVKAYKWHLIYSTSVEKNFTRNRFFVVQLHDMVRHAYFYLELKTEVLIIWEKTYLWDNWHLFDVLWNFKDTVRMYLHRALCSIMPLQCNIRTLYNDSFLDHVVLRKTK